MESIWYTGRFYARDVDVLSDFNPSMKTEDKENAFNIFYSNVFF